MDGKPMFAEVAYFFQAQVHGEKKALAMVSMCSEPHQGLLNESYGMLHVTSFTTGENLVVVDAKSIKSVVALLPFEQIAGHWFLFEDFGLDVALFATDDLSIDGSLTDDVALD